jgi:magnesium transporter
MGNEEGDVTANDPARSARDAGGTRSLPSGEARDEGLVRPAPAKERDSEDPPRAGDAAIGDCGLYEDGHRRPGRIPLDEAGDVARTTSGFVWIGLQQPTAKDVVAVADKFGLPPLAVEDAVKAHQRPKLEVYDDVVFAVLKPIRYVDHEEVVNVSEIALFLGARYVVTVRHGQSDVLRRVRSELDHGDSELLAHGRRVRSELGRGNSELLAYGPTGVLYRASDLVVDGYEEAITYINEDVDEIESQVFGSNGDDDHSERIYKLKREIAEFRRAVLPLATPLHRLADGSVPGLDKAAAPYFRDVHDHVLRAADAIEGHDRLLSDVLQADLSRVAARQARVAVRQNEIAVQQNEDMRKISAWAAIALVPTAIAGIYGMNFDNMPELAWEYGYFLIIGVIVSVCLGLYRLFRRNGWL